MMFWILFIAFVTSNFVNVKTQFDFEVRFKSQPPRDPQLPDWVEIYYNNQWWIIASSNWTSSNSKVLCRSLGYSDVNNFTLYDSRNFENSSIKPTRRSFVCTGTERGLQYCEQYDLQAPEKLNESVIEISCLGLKESRVRLVGGLSYKEGRAEVYHNGEWGTICMNGMVLSDATVLCRSAGFDTRHADYVISSRLPNSTNRIWIDNLRCDGSESDITECRELSWGQDNCTHADDIYIHCYSEFDIRLKSNILYGELEIYQADFWGSLCKSSYSFSDTTRDALVACHSLGFPSPIIGQYYTIGHESITAWDTYYRCDGSEEKLNECSHDALSKKKCNNRWVLVCMQTVVNITDTQRKIACENRCGHGYCSGDRCDCFEYWYGDTCDYYNYYRDYDDDDNDATAAIVGGSISGFIILILVIVGIIVYHCKKNPGSATQVTYSANQANLIPVVQIGAPGPHMSVVQPFSQIAVAGAQAPDTETKVPFTDDGVQPLDPPPYNQ